MPYMSKVMSGRDRAAGAIKGTVSGTKQRPPASNCLKKKMQPRLLQLSRGTRGLRAATGGGQTGGAGNGTSGRKEERSIEEDLAVSVKEGFKY